MSMREASDGEEEEEELLTKISHQKSLCVDRIQKAWRKHIDDILDARYCLTGKVGRDTLRVLATLAESEPLSRVKPILVSCILNRARQEPHDGQSRAKRLTRVDVLETKAIIDRENEMPKVTKPAGRRRAPTPNPHSPPAKHTRPRRGIIKSRSEASNAQEILDMSPEVGRKQGSTQLSDEMHGSEAEDLILDTLMGDGEDPSVVFGGGDLSYRSDCRAKDPLSIDQELTQIMHERCRQFKADMDALREQIRKNLVQAEEDFDNAYRPLKLSEIRLREVESLRDSTAQTYISAQSRHQRAQTAYTQHAALKDFGKDASFRGDINDLAEQLRNKWQEIEEEVENATESVEAARAAAMKQDQAYQEAETASISLRVGAEKARGVRDTCKDTLERMNHGPPGLTEMMISTFAGILPPSILAAEQDTSVDAGNGGTR